MIYLLKSIDTFNGYAVMERTDSGEEVFYNYGDWLDEIPKVLDNNRTSTEQSATRNGKTINWWLTKYPDYINAELIVRRKTREGYLQWLNEHPEFLI